MTKKVLDVGNCVPDHAAITRLLTSNFDCEVLQAHAARDALDILKKQGADLVLINRKLDADYSDGMEVLRQIKADPEVAAVPIMLITNYADHQDAAIKQGAIRGFGKLEFSKPETVERLAAVLSPSPSGTGNLSPQ